LLKAGQRAGQEVTEALGTAAGQHAKTIWAKLFPKVKERPAETDAVDDVAQNPDDELARSALQHQLRKLLRDDPALRDEIARMMSEAKRSGAITSHVTVERDVRADRGSIGVIGSIGGDLRMQGHRDDKEPG